MNASEIQLSVGALSETGYVREKNQDRMSGDALAIGNLYIVADGMGGYKGGALAAELAVEQLRENIGKAGAGGNVEDTLIFAFKQANQVIYEKNNSPDADYSQMGTTAVVLLVSDQSAKVAHVGDSRAYLFRDGSLSPITKDHTRVQRMVDTEILSEAEAEQHPDSHILERAIGIHEDVMVEVSSGINIKPGDAFLLCSDGLSGFVSDKEMESVLKSGVTAQQIPAILVEKSLQNGGSDNITVQFIQYGQQRIPDADDRFGGSFNKGKFQNIQHFETYIILFVTALMIIAGYYLLNW